MKKLILSGVILGSSVLLLTGCGVKKVTCTNETSTTGITQKMTSVGYFRNNKLTKIENEVRMTFDEEYASNITDETIDELKKTIEEEAKEEGYNVTVKRESSTEVSIKMNAKASELGDGENYGKPEDMKKELEESGFTCK